MKEIQAFVDEIYQSVGSNNKESQDIKAEMKNHLLESVDELKKEGKTEKEAIKIAIERFGGEKEMRTVLDDSFKPKKTYARQVLFLAIGFLLFTLTVLWFVLSNAAIAGSGQQFPEGNDIAKIIVNKDVISAKEKQQIEKILKNATNVSEVSIYNINDFFNQDGSITYDIDGKTPIYHYKKSLWVPEWLGVYLTGAAYATNDPWYIDMSYRNFDNLLQLMVLIGGIVYWTLFCIWASINAYHQKRLKIGWIFAFVFFNMFGYLLYSFSKRNKTQKKILI